MGASGAAGAAMSDGLSAALLDVRGLRTVYSGPEGPLAAVDGVDFVVRRGRTLGLVGESGAGKSAAALSVLGLLPPGGRVEAGEVRFEGEDLLRASARQWAKIRGRRIGAVFQDPSAALNPVLSIGEQVAETLRAAGLSRAEARTRAIAELRRVGLPDAERRYDDAPWQLSGGMRQRVSIAMAVAGAPDLLVLDEPTTALDVSLQAQVLHLLRELQEERGMAMLLITHDFGVVAECADDVVVLYAGRVVECGTAEDVLARPLHPYTRLLLRAVPDLERPERSLLPIPGRVPDPRARPSGCRFRDRCPLARETCATEPRLRAPAPESAPGSARETDDPPRAGSAHLAACPHVEEELP